jgi:hypothetical protein
MNRKIRHLKFVASAALVLGMLTGCLYPHRKVLSWEINGRVLNAITHAPIGGATVCLKEHPDVSCTSDAEGHFRIKEIRKFVLIVGPTGDSNAQYWDSTVIVSHPSYETYVEEGTTQQNKGEILLKSKERCGNP